MEDKDFRQGFGCSFLESLLRDLGERPVGSARIDRSEIEARIAALEVAHRHQLPPSTSPDVHRYTATLIVAYRALVAAGVDDPLGSIERAQAEATAVMREKVRAAPARIVHGPVGEWHEARERRVHAGSQTRDGLLFLRRVENRRTPEISRCIVTCSPGTMNNPG